MTIIYYIKTPNLEKFASFLSLNKIEIKTFKSVSNNECEIEINIKDKKRFLVFCKENNIEVKEVKLSFFYSFIRFLKQNVAFVLVALVVVAGVLFSNLFVLNTAIYGLSTISEKEILSVLKDNGYAPYKLRFNYDLDKINTVLTNNLSLVSFASAVIVGSTLVVNINEKIDNSMYLFDFKPILAPIDCVILDIKLLSGTRKKENLTSARQGEEVVGAYVLRNNENIPVPAKAEVRAKFEISATFKDSENVFDKEREKLYNKITSLNIENEIEEAVTHFSIEKTDYTTITLCGIFTFR